MPSIRAARPPNGLPDGNLDKTNRSILAALADNPRQSTAELARTVGMSAPAVRERVGRLEDLEDVLDAFLLFGQTTSSFVVATPVPPRPAGI